MTYHGWYKSGFVLEWTTLWLNPVLMSSRELRLGQAWYKAATSHSKSAMQVSSGVVDVEGWGWQKYNKIKYNLWHFKFNIIISEVF